MVTFMINHKFIELTLTWDLFVTSRLANSCMVRASATLENTFPKASGNVSQSFGKA